MTKAVKNTTDTTIFVTMFFMGHTSGNILPDMLKISPSAESCVFGWLTDSTFS